MENQGSDYAIVQELLTEFELIVDSYEQPRVGPGDDDEQQQYNSCKKKSHTFKNQVVSMPEAQDIVDVVVGAKGPTSDISLFRIQQQKFGSEQSFKGDSAKWAVSASVPPNFARQAYINGQNITTPHNKPRNGELSAEKKAENKVFSSNRIFVEHLIRLLKIFRIASVRFRLHCDTYEQIILTVCGESALREGFPPQATANPKGLVRLRIGSLVLPNLS